MKEQRIKEFKQLIKERDYLSVAKMYSGYAYCCQKEFNQILEEKNIKEGIFDILYKVRKCEYVDQI